MLYSFFAKGVSRLTNTFVPCLCGSPNYNDWIFADNIQLIECAKCGIKRVSHIDKDRYTARYKSGSYHAEDRSYDTGHKAHQERFEHDYGVAKLRLDRLLKLGVDGGKLLDVGCSNAAFVKAALDFEYDAIGCDLSTDAVDLAYSGYVWRGSIGECGFFRRTFDVITFNDVFEHIPDPITDLRIAKGLLKRTGVLVIEVPDMASKEAQEQREKFKHIKPHEHLWYFTSAQLRDLLEREGFNILHMEAPISGKITVYAAVTPYVEEVTIFGPPGIGDILWTLHKLPGIREREYPCRINYVVCVDGQEKLATRAKEFLQLFADVDSVEFRAIPLPRDVGNVDPSQPVYELIANDWLEPQNKNLNDWRPELAHAEHDWAYVPVPQAAIEQVAIRLRNTEKYVAVYMSSHVWNKTVCEPTWIARDWAELCIELNKAGLKPVILGADWDADFAKNVAAEIVRLGEDPSKTWINLTGRTPIALAMAYMYCAVHTIGICAGLPMIPAYMDWPTTILWPEKSISKTRVEFGKPFQTNWLTPENNSYKAHAIGNVTVRDIVDEIVRGLA